MGIWIELGVFALAFVFAIHQFHDLKKERLKREKAREQELKQSIGAAPPDPNRDR